MPPSGKKWTDQETEQLLGNLLRCGVIGAAVVVLLGGLLFLGRHGAEPAEHSVFLGEPERFRSVVGIAREVARLGSRGIIQLGLLLLIATPVARVFVAVIAFLRQRDYLYVLVSLLVLALLLYSLFSVSEPEPGRTNQGVRAVKTSTHGATF